MGFFMIKIMLVTINTDASVRKTFAGYAFWIVCDAGKIQKAGKIRNLVQSSSDAETMCIANAIHTLKHSKFKGITKVIINTDSKCAMEMLTNKAKSRVKNDLFLIVQECQFNMMEFCLNNGFSIRDTNKIFEFRHVKAHSGIKDNRSFVNEWCDKESKRYSKLRESEGE